MNKFQIKYVGYQNTFHRHLSTDIFYVCQFFKKKEKSTNSSYFDYEFTFFVHRIK